MVNKNSVKATVAEVSQPLRRSGKMIVVKVERGEHGANITSRDGKIRMNGHDMVLRRMAPDEHIAYFRSELLDGVLEIGDRVEEDVW